MFAFRLPFSLKCLKGGCASAGTFAVLNEMRSRRASTFFKKTFIATPSGPLSLLIIQSTSATPEMLRELRETLGPVLT
jgi:hypothetical protein